MSSSLVDLQPVELDIRQIKDALQHNSKFFIQFYLGEELTTPVPEFHEDIFDECIDTTISRLAEAVPRDFAKTTLAKLAAVWHFLFSPVRFCVYLSNTSSVAAAAANDIVGFLRAENHATVWGETRFVRERDSEGDYRFYIGDKFCILKSLGRGKQVRGLNIDNQRPQLLVVDDLEDEETAGSEVQFEKCRNWLYQAVFRALDKRWNKVIHIGNIHGALSILQNHCDSQFWHSRKYGCVLKDGSPLWPEMWSIENLRVDFLRYQEQGLTSLWFAEMMNMPPITGRRLIQGSEITYMPPVVPRDNKYAFITVDPAYSSKQWADYIAIAIHVFNEKYAIWQVAEVHAHRGMDQVDLLHHLVELCHLWNIRVVGVESYTFQEILRQTFSHLLALHYPHSDIKFLPVTHGNTTKTAHIANWAAMLKNSKKKKPSYALTLGDFEVTRQLLAYDPALKNNRDDVIDACAYGPVVTANYLHEVLLLTRGLPLDRATAQGTYAVSPI